MMAGYKALSPHVGFHAGEWPLWLGTQPVAEERKPLENSPPARRDETFIGMSRPLSPS